MENEKTCKNCGTKQAIGEGLSCDMFCGVIDSAQESLWTPKIKRTLGDFDIWYKPCEKCGGDEGKSTLPQEGNKRCWKCGNYIYRDFSDRALKKGLNPL